MKSSFDGNGHPIKVFTTETGGLCGRWFKDNIQDDCDLFFDNRDNNQGCVKRNLEDANSKFVAYWKYK